MNNEGENRYDEPQMSYPTYCNMIQVVKIENVDQSNVTSNSL